MAKSQKNKRSKKIILITGASSGIGKAVTLVLAKKGANIVAVGLNKKKLIRLTKDAIRSGGKVIPHETDLSKPKKIDALCRDILKKFRRIDWMVHSAGFIEPAEKKHKPDWNILKKTFSVNLFAPAYLDYKLKDNLKKNGGIIAISSTAALSERPDYPIYAASKSGLNIFSKSLAKYFSQNHKALSSIVICPGPTNTPMRERLAHDAKKHQSPEFVAGLIAKIISGRSLYKNGDIIIARNNELKIFERLNK